MKDELLFCPLGGSGEIGMNMNLFAYGKPGEQKWIIVDIGVTFADDTVPGVDLIYPGYLKLLEPIPLVQLNLVFIGVM